MNIRKTIKRLIALAEPHAAAPHVAYLMPDNGRGSGPGLARNGMLTLPPDHKFWSTGDLQDIEPEWLRIGPHTKVYENIDLDRV